MALLSIGPQISAIIFGKAAIASIGTSMPISMALGFWLFAIGIAGGRHRRQPAADDIDACIVHASTCGRLMPVDAGRQLFGRWPKTDAAVKPRRPSAARPHAQGWL